MSEIIKPLANVRDSVCAILKIFKSHHSPGKKKPHVVQFNLAFVGTAWCIVQNKYIVTAHHIFNNKNARDPNHNFYAFIVPNNGNQAFHFPIIGFPLEDSTADMAVMELGPPVNHNHTITAVPVTFARPNDGSKVLTYGFPSPVIVNASVDLNGIYKGGNFFLKGTANEGIISAQYDTDSQWLYEFNVGWHHGESGGPVFQLDPVAAFCVMQHYRTIQTPNGPVAGPHAGRSLEAIQVTLQKLGAKVV
jgi:hypothetical protein